MSKPRFQHFHQTPLEKPVTCPEDSQQTNKEQKVWRQISAVKRSKAKQGTSVSHFTGTQSFLFSKISKLYPVNERGKGLRRQHIPNSTHLWLSQLLDSVTLWLCSVPRIPLLAHFFLFLRPSYFHRRFCADREVGGAPLLPFNSSQPVTRQDSLPPGRYRLSAFTPISSTGAPSLRANDMKACGRPQCQGAEREGGREGGGRIGGIPRWIPGNRLNCRLLAVSSSHKVRRLEDVTHWLQREKEGGLEEKERKRSWRDILIN